MGSPKALLPLLGEPLLASHLQRFQALDIPVMVVLGYHAAQIVEQLPHVSSVAVWNPQPEQGQFSSLRCGLRAIVGEPSPLQPCTEPPSDAPKARSVLVTPVDVPPVEPAVLQTLLAAASSLPPEKALIPTWQGQAGHPILLGSQLVLSCLVEPPPPHLHAILDASEPHLRVEVTDPQVVLNLNTPQDVELWRQTHPRRPPQSFKTEA